VAWAGTACLVSPGQDGKGVGSRVVRSDVACRQGSESVRFVGTARPGRRWAVSAEDSEGTSPDVAREVRWRVVTGMRWPEAG